MQTNPIDETVLDLITKIKAKYEKNGQDFKAYLEGLLYQEYTNYWDYIQVDTLLSLQKPKTDIPDELIFIMYHQITELYFKLTIHEINQLQALKGNLSAQFFIERLNRMNAYFKNLTQSFEIMIQGMEPAQFLKFRMSLLPASGFQSAQYRLIEICATPIANLVHKDKREAFLHKSVAEQLEAIYWKSGATEVETGKKTLTLTQFEAKYADEFLNHAQSNESKNLWMLYLSMPEADQENADLKAALRAFDKAVNIDWPLVHYKSAVRYLQKSQTDVAATGGTNWQKYLPPRFQFRIFYPELYSQEEIDTWGTNNQ